MTTKEIKRVLRSRKERRLRPWSLYQLAALRGCSRSVMTGALKTPTRYRDARIFIESHLQ